MSCRNQLWLGFSLIYQYQPKFSHSFSHCVPQSYTGQTGGGGGGGGGGGTGSGNGAGDEDYEIPPITPPNHPEPPLLHLMEHDSTGYLCHSLPHNGLINPYSYPELPTLMMSNMLAQDSHLVSSQMPSVSSTTWTELFHGGTVTLERLVSENIFSNRHKCFGQFILLITRSYLMPQRKEGWNHFSLWCDFNCIGLYQKLRTLKKEFLNRR